VINEFDLY
jgi:hypothetical protein